MQPKIFKKLFDEKLITETEYVDFQQAEKNKTVSVHWDLKTLLYAGILLVTSGLGILVYKYIETIGHAVVITIIAIGSIACFFYCIKKSHPYSNKKVESPNFWFDYILLAGCLLLLTFIGYLQFQYNVFGNRLGMATFLPMVILFIAAYYFDHLGVLSLAITNLAAWAGVTVTPFNILTDNDFSSEKLIYTGIILGLGLITIALVSIRRDIKAHFDFTYKNFGVHTLFIACLAAMFHFESYYLLWFLVIAAVTAGVFVHSLRIHSFYFLVITVLYFYIAVSYLVIKLLFHTGSTGGLYLLLIYFIASGIGLIKLLIHYNKLLKKNDSL